MVGWIFFIGLLMLNLGFFLGCVYTANKVQDKIKEQSFGELKPLSEEEKVQQEKAARKQKQILDDINFLNNFTGEKEENDYEEE